MVIILIFPDLVSICLFTPTMTWNLKAERFVEMVFVAFNPQVPWILINKVSKFPFFYAGYSHNNGVWYKVADF